MKKLLTYILISFTLLSSLAAMPLTAQNVEARSLAIEYRPSLIPKPDNLPGPDVDDQSDTGTRRILTENVIPNFIVGTIGFFAAVALLFLMIGAVRFMTLYGNEEGIEKARNQIIYSIVGLLIAILSYTIVTIIINLQYDEINVDRPQTESSSPATTDQSVIPADPNNTTTIPNNPTSRLPEQP